ncbi:TPA: DUF551 domain-containing protein [Raoultella ornithinolytica]|nr:DUF551 domain-containing protein [Raoultella ornithinolytica]
MEGIGHIRRTLEETFGGLHGTHVEPDVLAECKAICDAIYAAYGHAQPAPVVMDDRKLRSLFDSWFASDCSFDLSPEASEADNIAWRESYWYVWQRCRAAMLQAGTLTNEGTKQAGNSPVIPCAEQRIADAVELLKQAAPAMLADNGGPNGPLVGRLKSPAIPDGYVMVPKGPTQAMCAAFNDSDYGRKSLRERYVAMLAAAAHDTPALNSVQSVATVPGKWVPVSERMPETDGNYWGWWSESKRKGPVWFIKSELQAQFQSHEITHWMPLPADPQEVNNG